MVGALEFSVVLECNSSRIRPILAKLHLLVFSWLRARIFF